MKRLNRKQKAALIIIGAAVLCIIITGVCVMFFNSHGDGNQRIKDSSITELESLNLRLSGMRITEEYEFIADGAQTEISYYNMSYADGNEERVLIKRTTCNTDKVIDALNSFNMIKWDGFYGKHPKGVLDGTMFNLTATVNGGKKLSAEGSQNFPKHFHDFEAWLYDALKDCEELN